MQMDKIKVLVIGCGNIGCGYDWNTDFVRTHCKALFQLNNVAVSVYDENVDLASSAAEKYSYRVVSDISKVDFSFYQWVIIASPTPTHFDYLRLCFLGNVPLVICEKPVATAKSELEKLEELYNAGKTKVLINYIRRFQEPYIELRKKMADLKIQPSVIAVKYQRGLNNNFSHAADIIAFLLGAFDLKDLHIVSRVFDEFAYDPTTSFTAMLNDDIPLFAMGIANAKYSYFEIEFFYSNCKISLIDNGSEIIWNSADINGSKFYQPLKKIPEFYLKAILDNLMTGVYENAMKVFAGLADDNFLSSINTNKTLLKIKQHG
jgi:predicted dehydrogenase